MPTNDFLAFAAASGANVESQINYAADPLLPIGNQPGIAVSAFNNKAIRQSSIIMSQVAQFMANQTNTNVQDSSTTANLAQILSQLQATFMSLPRITTHYTTAGSGTHVCTTYFFVAAANATASATYTNNSITFTVSKTISGGTLLQCTGNGSTTANSGVLTKTGGTGDATITFYALRIPLSIRARGVGAGGGGGGSGTSGNTGGGTGGNTTFGSGLNVANGGVGGGGSGATGGTGGAASLGSGWAGIALAGAQGQGGRENVAGAEYASGSMGGSSVYGGAGAGVFTGGGGAAAINSGSGGGGGGINNVSTVVMGGGGGAGAYFDATLGSPAISYPYVVGAKGTSVGTGGASGFDGGAGADGQILIEESF